MDKLNRADIVERLRQLQTVSIRLEELMRRMRQGEALSPEERRETELLAAEQGTIVQVFVELSDDAAGIAQYQEATRGFQKHLEELQNVQDVQRLAELRQQVSASVDAWVASLETLIRGVLRSAG